MKEIIEYILLGLTISLALMANVVIWLLIYDEIKERLNKHD